MDGTIQPTGREAKRWRRRERSDYPPRNGGLRGEPLDWLGALSLSKPRATYKRRFRIARIRLRACATARQKRAPTFGSSAGEVVDSHVV